MKERTIEHGKLRMEALSEYRSEIYGISIFWVMLFHMKESHYFPTIEGSNLYHAWMKFVGMGNMGVDIFLFYPESVYIFLLQKIRISMHL